MPYSTKLFKMIPWTGGVNTSVNRGVVSPNQLVQGDNMVFASRTARRMREGINFDWDDQTADPAEDIVGLYQFWYEASNTKTYILVGVSTDGNIYSYSTGGTRTQLTDNGTAYADSITKASFCTYNNKLIICVDGYNNVTKYWDGSANVDDLSGAPRASICNVFQGRLFLNDKTSLDRLHFCEAGDHTKWYGNGDSGAIYIGQGDGDPEGITAIFPPYRGDLVIGKHKSLYRVKGYSPETWSITNISSGIGCISHNSVAAVDNTDIAFVSERGVHSLAATDAYGDLESQFLSADIHDTFITQFDRTNLEYSCGGYVPELQSIMFTFEDSDFTDGYRNSIWLYNLIFKAWYRWSRIPCQAMAIVDDSDRTRMYFGGNNNRVYKSQTGDFNDIDNDGNDLAIRMELKTGIIYPEHENIVKGFKRLYLHYEPTVTHDIEVRAKIDNLDVQILNFSAELSSDLLGVDFILGQSILGTAVSPAPYSETLDGYGRGIELTLIQEAVDQFVEIQGFSIEYDIGGPAQEVVVP